MKSFTIGIDFGTNSVRAIIIDCASGQTIGENVFNYPSGMDGILHDERDHHLARQNPSDYIRGLEISVKEAMKKAQGVKRFSPDKIIGIGVDTTGSTPIPVDRRNVPLAFHPKFRKNLAAHAWLWKDHTAADEASRVTEMARIHRPHYLSKYGRTYSSEWFWSKVWHCLNCAPEVFEAAYSWVECCDFIPAVLAGIDDPLAVRRSVCAAGHKAMYCDEWDGLPDKEFLSLLDPRLAAIRDRLYVKAYDGHSTAGTLCKTWAKKLGLPAGIPIAIGAFDAHMGAVGAGVAEGVLVKIIGTSTCDITVSPLDKKIKHIPGICGIVNGSVLPGCYGIEAGQSAVGDIFKWFIDHVCGGETPMHEMLTREASRLKPGQSGLLALDWNNGNRTILVDPRLSGLLVGQTLYTSRAEIYRTLIEATAFGARAITERLQEYGIRIDRIVCCGGIADKNPMLMQIYADVTGCPMQISASAQTCALGSAIAAAVAAGKEKGGYDSFEEAQKAMTSIKKKQYVPIASNRAVYDRLYVLYRTLHDAFGGVKKDADLSMVMKQLIALREEQSP